MGREKEKEAKETAEKQAAQKTEAEEKKKLEEVRGLKQQKDIDKHLAITLEAYKKCLSEVDKLHMKAVIELKSMQNKSDRLAKLAAK